MSTVSTVQVSTHRTPAALWAHLSRLFPVQERGGTRWVTFQAEGVTFTFFAAPDDEGGGVMADAANPPVEAEASASVLYDADRLARLYAELSAVIEAVNDEDEVPERSLMTLRGLLADADYERLLAIRSVVHRLHLWAKFPSVSPERYTR